MANNNSVNEYVLSFPPPAEAYFFTKAEKDKLAQDEKKLTATQEYVAIMISRPDLLPEYEKGTAEGKYYSSRQAINVLEELRAMEGNGPRYDLKQSLVSPTGQVVMMSEPLVAALDLISDDYILQEDLPQLVKALQQDGVASGDVDKVTRAANQYGAIILQRGGFTALRSLLNEVVEVNHVKSSFESYQNKLAQRPAPAPVSAHGSSLNALKGALQAAKPAASVAAQASKPNMTPAEIKREVSTKELLKPTTPQPSPRPAQAPMPPPRPVPPPQPMPRPVPPPEPRRAPSPQPAPRPPLGVALNKIPKLGLATLASINVVDDLRKIEAAHLRQGSLAGQVKTMKEKIIYLAQANHLLPVQVESVFEQSPLFNVYLQIGNAIMSAGAGQKPDYNLIVSELSRRGQEVLSLSEFESIADLRKDMEHM